MAQKIKLSTIIVDSNFQPRAKLNQQEIENYAELIKEGTEFPPIVVFKKNEDSYILASGFHRFEAHKKLELTEISAEIREGSELDILIEAIQSNSRHGLRLTNEDKWRSVSLILNDSSGKNWSDNHIATTCGVSNHLVKKVRLDVFPEQEKDTSVVALRQGQEIKIETENIGPKPTSRPSIESISKKLDSKVHELIKVLNLFKESHQLPEVEIPSEFDEAIYEFVQWYTSKKGA